MVFENRLDLYAKLALNHHFDQLLAADQVNLLLTVLLWRLLCNQMW